MCVIGGGPDLFSNEPTVAGQRRISTDFLFKPSWAPDAL